MKEIICAIIISLHMITLTVQSEQKEVPLYFQTDYITTQYGQYGTVATHGCGITSLSMVLSYLTDEEILPDELAEKYGKYNTKHGSSFNLFFDVPIEYGLEKPEQVWNFDSIVESLEEGKVIIATAHNNIFTDGDHFIVLTGLTNDGKIMVNDPYQPNYERLKDGFENGFELESFKYSCRPFFIFEKSS